MSLTDNLLNLFQVDAQVRGLRSRLDSAQRYLAVQTRQVQELEQLREELQSRKRQLTAKISNFEGETAAIDERIEKLRSELNGASTDKQYSAVLTELNTVKVSRGEFDDRILQEMERIEEVNEQLAKLDVEYVERQKVAAVAESELLRRHEDVSERLAELEADREVAAAGILPAELRIFNEMADAYDGEAMAPVEEVDRRNREYACGACNMHTPFATVAALLGVIDSVVRCTACGRILYLEEETRGALVKK
ncbi:MAG: zinc ribbon domain-containing protein [Planctomycetota bacterium]|jgi:predicted  nucleic acid-binding Zn-ribbon protein